MLEKLPHKRVAAKDLRAFLADKSQHDTRQVIICQFTSEDVAEPIDGSPFDKQRYYREPEKFKGRFHEYLDCVDFLINDIYWETKYPRIISKESLRKAVEAGKCRLKGVSDVSADECGSIEFTSRFTDIEDPFLLYNPLTEEFKEKISEMGPEDILFTSVDHLPAEMPREASSHFSVKLSPFVEQVAKSAIGRAWPEQVADLPVEIANAVICSEGELTPNFVYIQ